MRVDERTRKGQIIRRIDCSHFNCTAFPLFKFAARLLKSDDMKITMESDRYYCIGWLGSAVLMKQQQTDKKKRQPSSSLSSVCWMDFRVGGKGIFSFPRKFGMFLLAAHRMGVTEKLHTNERRASTSDLSLAHKNAVLNAQSAKKYCTTLSHSFSCSI